MTSWRAREVKALHHVPRLIGEDGRQKMRSSRRLYSLLNSSIRRGTDFPRATRSGQQIWRPTASCYCFSSHEVDGRRWVHPSGLWPNTQPHVLNGDGGATDLYQLTTVEDLKAWFEARKKEIYGMWMGTLHRASSQICASSVYVHVVRVW